MCSLINQFQGSKVQRISQIYPHHKTRKSQNSCLVIVLLVYKSIHCLLWFFSKMEIHVRLAILFIKFHCKINNYSLAIPTPSFQWHSITFTCHYFTYMHIYQICTQCPQRLGKGIRFTRTRVSVISEPPYGCWDLDPEELLMIVTSEPALHHVPLIFLIRIKWKQYLRSRKWGCHLSGLSLDPEQIS